MTDQSTEPKTVRSSRRRKIEETSETPDGQALGGMRLEGLLKSSSRWGTETEGRAAQSPYENGTTAQND